MARRTKAEALETRECILDAAELCFLEQGVYRTTLEGIASRAGFTRGAVYWNFKNKLELLNAVMDRVELPLLGHLEELIRGGSGGEPLSDLRDFHCRVLQAFETDEHARNTMEIILLKCELTEETQPIFERRQRDFDRVVETFTRVLESARRRKQLRAGLSPKACAVSLYFVVNGILRDWLLDQEALSLTRWGMSIVDTLLTSFAPEP